MKKTQSLNGNWTLYYAPETSGRQDSYDAVMEKEFSHITAEVPGCVQLDLHRAGIEPEPFYADNIHLYAKYEYYQCR